MSVFVIWIIVLTHVSRNSPRNDPFSLPSECCSTCSAKAPLKLSQNFNWALLHDFLQLINSSLNLRQLSFSRCPTAYYTRLPLTLPSSFQCLFRRTRKLHMRRDLGLFPAFACQSSASFLRNNRTYFALNTAHVLRQDALPKA